MKKLTSAIIILALVAIIGCFAACGGEVKDDLTSAQDKITSMLDDATTAGEELESDISEALDGTTEDKEENTAADETEKETTAEDETTKKDNR